MSLVEAMVEVVLAAVTAAARGALGVVEANVEIDAVVVVVLGVTVERAPAACRAGVST